MISKINNFLQFLFKFEYLNNHGIYIYRVQIFRGNIVLDLRHGSHHHNNKNNHTKFEKFIHSINWVIQI